ncbi:MAG TPA: glycosyltransferase family 2 protein [Dehalococcoidia bacterium]|nr:glycosyltransferase family 2 protein [Dehalococcoidia bacterium]
MRAVSQIEAAPAMPSRSEERVAKVKAERALTITALVCALNEEGSLPYVLPRIPGWVDEVLLVDGHSVDATVELARSLCPAIRVLRQSGQGKGDALKCGVAAASGDIVVTLDADGETDPVDLPRFVEPLLAGHDLAKGSRLSLGRPARMPRYRWLGNKLLALTYNLLFGTHYTDVCSGYSAFWKSSFQRLRLTYDNCEMEQQLLVRARKAGMSIAEVAHGSEGRLSGASKVSGIKQGLIDWWVIVKERFGA